VDPTDFDLIAAHFGSLEISRGGDWTNAGGNDSIDGGAGSDTINAGAGDDFVTAEDGSSDSLDGGSGTDTLATLDYGLDTYSGGFESLSPLQVNKANGVNGTTSLGDAIAYANTHAGPDTITFDPAVFGSTSRTIYASDLEIGDSSGTTTIVGPGVDLLTVNANGAAHVFSTSQTVSISGITLTGANEDDDDEINGGAVYNTGILSMSGCNIHGNTTYADGSGIYSSGTLNLTNCSIGANSTTNYSGTDGGGVFIASGIANIIGCTIANNYASENGGGICVSSGTVSLVNSTIADNISDGYDDGGGGGGIFSYSGTLNIINCTISANHADDGRGGGIYNFDGTLTMKNSIDAGNFCDFEGAEDIYGGFVIHGTDKNLIGGDAGLGALADNGGPTETMALLSGSAAISTRAITVSFQPGLPPANAAATASMAVRWTLRHMRRKSRD
jgi:hypothetical protein